MMKILDTNICSYILRRHPQSLLQRFADQEAENLAIFAIVAAELRYGTEKLGSERFMTQVEEWLTAFPILPWTDAASHCYAKLRVHLERQGLPIGNMDLLIAAHALAEDATLITHNTREFQRIPQLKLEDWH